MNQLSQVNDEKDLEVSRLRRDTEDLSKKNKSLNEKIVEYQKTNERQRKDMETIKEDKEKLLRDIDI